MWKTTVGGRALHFRLVGINNQNFLMEDLETGSWWQQVTGEAIHGPLAGERLERVPSDEVRFAVWRAEHPRGRVLRGDDAFRDSYLDEDWAAEVAELPTVVPEDPDAPLPPRELIVGLELGGVARAYPLAVLVEQNPVLDRLGGVPVVLVVDRDGRSVRVFDRRLDGRELELFRVPDSDPVRLLDAETGSTWDFAGNAVDGPLAGARLERLQPLKEYFFDWRVHHPDTGIYSAGL